MTWGNTAWYCDFTLGRAPGLLTNKILKEASDATSRWSRERFALKDLSSCQG